MSAGDRAARKRGGRRPQKQVTPPASRYEELNRLAKPVRIGFAWKAVLAARAALERAKREYEEAVRDA